MLPPVALDYVLSALQHTAERAWELLPQYVMRSDGTFQHHNTLLQSRRTALGPLHSGLRSHRATPSPPPWVEEAPGTRQSRAGWRSWLCCMPRKRRAAPQNDLEDMSVHSKLEDEEPEAHGHAAALRAQLDAGKAVLRRARLHPLAASPQEAPHAGASSARQSINPVAAHCERRFGAAVPKRAAQDSTGRTVQSDEGVHSGDARAVRWPDHARAASAAGVARFHLQDCSRAVLPQRWMLLPFEATEALRPGAPRG